MPPPYPRTKPKKSALYAATLAGIAANPGDYPSGAGAMFDTATLSARNVARIATVSDRIAKEAALRLAVAAENAAFESCDQEERRLIGLAEAQYGVAAPDKLREVGWGPRGTPQSAVPGQPRQLAAIRQDADSLALKWKAPAPGSGGSVSFYRIERQTQSLAGEVMEVFGVWTTQSVRAAIVITGLTRGLNFSFRVVAVNGNGDSIASNTIDVVL